MSDYRGPAEPTQLSPHQSLIWDPCLWDRPSALFNSLRTLGLASGLWEFLGQRFFSYHL